jgi:hypothetical protein
MFTNIAFREEKQLAKQDETMRVTLTLLEMSVVTNLYLMHNQNVYKSELVEFAADIA